MYISLVILLTLISLVMFEEGYIIRFFVVSFSSFSVASLLVQIFSSAPCSQTPSICVFLPRVKDQVSCHHQMSAVFLALTLTRILDQIIRLFYNTVLTREVVIANIVKVLNILTFCWLEGTNLNVKQEY